MKNPITHLPELFSHGTRWLRSLTRRDSDDIAQPPTYWDESVSLTLSNLVQETETRASGRVQLLSLGDFREAVGELWDKYKSKVLLIAESTISRMIGKGNTYIPQGDDAWLLLFPGFSEDKAQQRADAIAANIGEKLVGAQFTAQELPLPATSRLDLANALNADGSLNLEAVKQAISKVKRAQISAVVAANRPKSPVRPAILSPMATSTLVTRSEAERLKPFFHPAWCAETESIDLFCFRAATEGGGDIYADNASRSNDATVLDLTRTAAAAFTAMCDSGLNAKMSIPLPFSALHGTALADIQRLIAGLRQRDRLLRLRLEVMQIPPDATADMLVPIRELFRPYVREVAFMVDLFSPHDQVLALDHIMLGADISKTSDVSEEHMFQEMLMFRQRAGRRGIYVLGLQDRAYLKRAINAGIGEVGGPALTEDVKRLPHRITIIQREQLLTP